MGGGEVLTILLDEINDGAFSVPGTEDSVSGGSYNKCPFCLKSDL